MNYFALILPKLVSFLILLSVGYFVAWRGILRREGMTSIAALLIRVVLPCLSADLLIEQGIDVASLADYAVPVLWMLAAYAVMTAVGAAGARLAGLKGLLKNVHIGCSIGGNYAFVVLPLAMALFTAQEQSIIPIGSAVDTTVAWTLGLGIFTRGRERESLRGRIKRFFTPVLLSIILALTLNTLKLRLPECVLTPVRYIGQVSYSLGFIYVGASLYYMPKRLRGYVRPLALLAAGRLVIAPLAVYLISRRFVPEYLSIFLMLVAGAPVMSTSCTICRQYALDEEYAAAAVFVTTLGCMASIPLLFGAISLLG